MRLNEDMGLVSPWAEAAIMLAALAVGLVVGLLLNLRLDVAAGEAVLSGTVVFFIQLTAYLSWRLAHTVNALIIRLTHLEDDVAELRAPGGVADMIADASAVHANLADRLQAVEDAVAPMISAQRHQGPHGGQNPTVGAANARPAPVAIQERNAARRQGHKIVPVTVVDELNEHYEENSPLPRMLAPNARPDVSVRDASVRDAGMPDAADTRARRRTEATGSDINTMMRELADEIKQPRSGPRSEARPEQSRPAATEKPLADAARAAISPRTRSTAGEQHNRLSSREQIDKLNEIATEQGRSLREASTALRRLSPTDGATVRSGTATQAAATRTATTRNSGNPDSLQSDRILELVRQSAASGIVDIHLQPVVSLHDQRVQHYDICPRLANAGGSPLLPEHFQPVAAAAGLKVELESAMLSKTVDVLQLLASKGRSNGLFCDLSLDGVKNAALMRDFLERMKQHKHLTHNIILQLEESELARLSASDIDGLNGLIRLGFRLGLRVRGPVALDAEKLRLIKISFFRIGAGTAGRMTRDQFAALQHALKQFEIELIVEGVDDEAGLAPIHQAGALLVQGALIGTARPARTEIGTGSGSIVAA